MCAPTRWVMRHDPKPCWQPTTTSRRRLYPCRRHAPSVQRHLRHDRWPHLRHRWNVRWNIRWNVPWNGCWHLRHDRWPHLRHREVARVNAASRLKVDLGTQLLFRNIFFGRQFCTKMLSGSAFFFGSVPGRRRVLVQSDATVRMQRPRSSSRVQRRVKPNSSHGSPGSSQSAAVYPAVSAAACV